MTASEKPTCRIVRAEKTFGGKQGFDYFEGIAKETVGSTGICMHLLTIPPGGRARAHKHEHHETAIYVLDGEAKMHFGNELDELMTLKAGDLLYIPADMPHLPFNPGDDPFRAVIARTDPNEQESVVLLPQLENRLEDRLEE